MLSFDDKTIQYLGKEIKNFESFSKSVHKKPEIEKVHKLRVSIRRIRSILGLGSIKIKSLQKLNKELGKVRDLDVAIGHTKKYQLNAAKLKDDRQKYRKKVHKLLAKKHRKKIENELESFLIRLESRPHLTVKFSTSPLSTRLKKFHKKISPDALHELRIVLKKVRYLFEASGKPVGYLKKAQTDLGSLHDLEVLQEYFTENKKIQRDKERKSLKAQKFMRPVVTRAQRELRSL